MSSLTSPEKDDMQHQHGNKLPIAEHASSETDSYDGSLATLKLDLAAVARKVNLFGAQTLNDLGKFADRTSNEECESQESGATSSRNFQEHTVRNPSKVTNIYSTILAGLQSLEVRRT